MVAAGLTALFSLLEFVEQLASVGQGRYHLADALVYVLLTVPSRLLRVTPVSMLIGCLLALGALARNSELTALRSLGISEGRIVASVLKLVLPLVVALFLIAQFVVPPAQQMAQMQRLSALSASDLSLLGNDGLWVHDDHEFLNVKGFDRRGAPRGIDLYAFAGNGALESSVHADRAAVQPDGGWLLSDVLRKSVTPSGFRTERIDSLSWRPFMSLRQMRILMLPPDSMPPIALYRYVRALRARHQAATRYEQELWTQISIPVSLVAMIAIAAPFVFGSPRAQNSGRQIAIGAVLGIVFTLSQQIAGHLALLLNLNPAAATLAPSFLLVALAVDLFHRAHR
ncbi:MAG: LPS export ABC transporter permease LptG [Alphaproteobacteria bacterium]|nr:LPS export ABC transporter permease LptG [Alphaproteobacteria bacterium]